MKKTMKTTMVIVLASGLVALVMPSLKAGSGCGTQSSCPQTAMSSTLEASNARGTTSMTADYAAVSNELLADCNALEYQVNHIMGLENTMELQTQLVELRARVVALRDKFSRHSQMGYDMMSSMGHDTKHYDMNKMTPMSDGHEGHIH